MNVYAAVPNSNECGFCGAELDKSAADLMSQSFNQLTSVLFSSVDSGRNSAGGGGSVFNRGSVCSDCHKVPKKIIFFTASENRLL